MYRLKCLIAMFGVSLAAIASIASQASAVTAGWVVNGTTLTGTAALATGILVDKTYELGVAEAGVTIVCQGKTANSVAPTINGATEMLNEASLELTECSGQGLCSLATKSFRTTPSLYDLTLDGVLAAKGRILAISKDLATLKFEGSECGIAGVQPLTGSSTFLLPEGQDERTLVLFTATNEEPGSLKLGKASAIVSYSYLYHTPNGVPFSFK